MQLERSLHIMFHLLPWVTLVHHLLLIHTPLFWAKYTHSLGHARPFFSKEFSPTKMRSGLSWRTLWPTCVMHNVACRTAVTMCIRTMLGLCPCPPATRALCPPLVLRLIHWLLYTNRIQILRMIVSSRPRRCLALPLLQLRSDFFFPPFFFILTKKGRRMSYWD